MTPFPRRPRPARWLPRCLFSRQPVSHAHAGGSRCTLMNPGRTLLVATTFILLAGVSGCYRAVIEAPAPAGTEMIDIPWAHGFLGGLVPPNEVDAATRCPGGVARVVTQHSFLNLLAQGLTFGLYSPMHITVTCAATDSAAAPDLPVARNLAEAEARLEAEDPFLLPLRIPN